MSNELSPGGASPQSAAQILAKLTAATTLAVGAMLFGAGSSLLSTLSIGTNGYVLTVAAGVPSWAINPGAALPASYVIGDLLYASSSSALSRLADVAVGQVLVSGGVGVAPSWSASPSVTGTVTAKPTTTAGIALDPNAATGNFTLSLSPANLTAARRWSFPDRTDTVAGLGAQTFVGVQTFAASGNIIGNISGSNVSKLRILADATGAALPQHVEILCPGTVGNVTGIQIGYNDGSGGNAGAIAGITGKSSAGTAYPNVIGLLDFTVQNAAVASSVLSISPSQATFSSATDATNLTTAALVVNGGAAVAKTLRVGLGLVVGGTLESSKASSAVPITAAGASLRLYDAGLGAGLWGQQASGAPFAYHLQAADATMGSLFPISLQPRGGAVIIGADPGGSALLRVGGTALFAGGTITTALPVIDSSVTWNAGGVTFSGIKLNVTDTASAAASLLLDLQVGGVSKFSIRKDGAHLLPVVVVGGTTTVNAPPFDATQTWNQAGTAFSGIKLNITDTASNTASYLLDLLVGGGRLFAVRKDGALTANFLLDEVGTVGNIFTIKTVGTTVFTMTNIGIANLTTNAPTTSAISTVFGITSNCSGTVANGFGTGININLKTISSAATTALTVSAEWVDAITASHKSRAKISVNDAAGTRECLRMEASGSASMLGFLGAAASARITFAAWTGTATRTTFATSTATLANVAEAVKALVDDLRTFGLYG